MDSARVVLIRYRRDGEERIGSGLLMGGQIVLTADHCANGDQHTVTTNRAPGHGEPAIVVARSEDPVVDLALLDVPSLAPLRPMPFAAGTPRSCPGWTTARQLGIRPGSRSRRKVSATRPS
jgi:Trypsin-like peptidase domain